MEQDWGVHKGTQPSNWASIRAITKGKEILSVDALTVEKPKEVVESSEQGLIVIDQKRRRIEEECDAPIPGCPLTTRQPAETLMNV